MQKDEPDERWHSRGYLPHVKGKHFIQHITFHLADSLPKDALLRLQESLRDSPPTALDIEKRRKVEAWLDAGFGNCILRAPDIARMVQESLLFHHAQRYQLHAWVVMPNHVHVLLQSLNGWTIAKIVGTWKKFTARRILELCPPETVSPKREQPVWHREYWDRFVRNEEHYARVVNYIEQNPVKAGLVAEAEEWPWGSTSARRDVQT